MISLAVAPSSARRGGEGGRQGGAEAAGGGRGARPPGGAVVGGGGGVGVPHGVDERAGGAAVADTGGAHCGVGEVAQPAPLQLGAMVVDEQRAANSDPPGWESGPSGSEVDVDDLVERVF